MTQIHAMIGIGIAVVAIVGIFVWQSASSPRQQEYHHYRGGSEHDYGGGDDDSYGGEDDDSYGGGDDDSYGGGDDRHYWGGNDEYTFRHRKPSYDYHKRNVPKSNPYNNHDDQKVPYSTREEAEYVREKIQRRGDEDSERLTVYHNEELDKFFIGRKKYDD